MREKEDWKTLPPLPDLDEYANSLFEAYGYYKHLRGDRETELLCSECGDPILLVDERIAENEFMLGFPPNTKVSRWQSMIRSGAKGHCPCCGAKITYKARGRAKKRYTDWKSFLLGQASEDGETLWLRIFDTNKTYYRDSQAEIKIRETRRIKLQRDRKPVKYGTAAEYDKDWHAKSISWVTDGIATMLFGDVKDGEVHPDTWEAIENSFLKYAGVRNWYYGMEIERIIGQPYRSIIVSEASGKLIKICASFAYYPMLEYLDKQGYTDLVEGQIRGNAIIGRRGRKPWDRLGVTREHMSLLRDEPGWIWALKEEKKRGERWKGRDLAYICGGLNRQRIYKLKDEYGISYTKQENYIKKTGMSVAQWLDYLEMKKQEGYALDSIALFPKNLRQAHDRIVEEVNAREAERRKREKDETYKAIREKFKELTKRYMYTRRGMIIRPAMSAAEIIEEGRTLHHCVGASDMYMGKHARGESYILFLRTETFKPYATVEINAKTGEVMQWYEAYDKKPNKDTIEPWLKEYTERLKRKGA